MFKIILTGLGAAVCFSIGQTVFASTNDIHLDVLLTAQGNFTNATIIRHNPAYAIVFYPYGAGMVRLADSNLPPDLQKQFGYSPSNAAAFLESEKENAIQAAKAYAAKQAAYRAYLASLAGTNRVILITSIDDETRIMQCAAIIDGRNKEIFIRNLPAAVKDFVNGYNQLRANILALGERVHSDARAADRADAFAPVGAAGDADFVNAAMAPRNRANQMILNANDEADNLTEMEANMDQMAKEVPEKTAVIAYPSSEFWGDQQVWVCTGVPQQ